jgi:DNA-directed RNA polymerase specialized sigma24 family protein
LSDNRATARDGLSPETGQHTAAQSDFIDFYRAGYRKVTAAVMAFGATPEEAADATQSAMETVLRRWDQIDAPLAYAKKAALHSFYKEKERGLDRVRQRLAQGARRKAPKHSARMPTMPA